MSTATVEKAVDQAAAAESKKPVKVFRHRAVSASIFANRGKKDDDIWYSVSLQRAYKVGDEFKHSSSFTRDELPVARHLLQQAWAFILDQETSQKNDQE
jgi:hypothetical protein